MFQHKPCLLHLLPLCLSSVALALPFMSSVAFNHLCMLLEVIMSPLSLKIICCLFSGCHGIYPHNHPKSRQMRARLGSLSWTFIFGRFWGLIVSNAKEDTLIKWWSYNIYSKLITVVNIKKGIMLIKLINCLKKFLLSELLLKTSITRYTISVTSEIKFIQDKLILVICNKLQLKKAHRRKNLINCRKKFLLISTCKKILLQSKWSHAP